MKHLTIRDCNDNEDRFELILKYCKNVRFLELTHFHLHKKNVILDGIPFIHLQILKITFTLLVSDEFLVKLFHGCQQLVSVDISGESLPSITNMYIYMFIRMFL